MSATDEQLLELLRLVKEQSLTHKGLLSEDEFMRLVDQVVPTAARSAPDLSGGVSGE